MLLKITHITMKHIKFLFSLIVLLTAMPVMSISQSASQYMKDATLVNLSKDNKTIVIRSSGQAEKKKDALMMAEKSALYTLLHVGIDGVNSGRALCKEDVNYDRRLFYENRYTVFLVSSNDLDNYRKIGKEYRAEVEVTFAYANLLKDLERNGLTGMGSDNPLTSTTLPSITIVPFIAQGENQLSILEGNSLRRSCAASVTSMFSKKGYFTKDYLSMVRNANNNDILMMGTQSDVVTKLLQNSGTDVKVEVRVSFSKGNTNLSSAVVEITAIEAFTSTTLASVKLSGQARGDSTYIVDQIIESNANAKKRSLFFNELNRAFATMATAGLEVNVNFGLSNNIDDWTFDDDMPDGKNFKEELESWLESVSVDGNARMDINNDKYIGLSVRIPFYGNDKKTFKVSGFRTALRKYLKEILGDAYTAKIVAEGQKITVTIQ